MIVWLNLAGATPYERSASIGNRLLTSRSTFAYRHFSSGDEAAVAHFLNLLSGAEAADPATRARRRHHGPSKPKPHMTGVVAGVLS